MYEFISRGKGKAESLREAQLWLKDPDKHRDHTEMFENLQNQVSSHDQQRGFVVSWDEWEEFLPDDLHSPYHWAAFVCTGGK
jgi:CHAT domain-containing protein